MLCPKKTRGGVGSHQAFHLASHLAFRRAEQSRAEETRGEQNRAERREGRERREKGERRAEQSFGTYLISTA